MKVKKGKIRETRVMKGKGKEKGKNKLNYDGECKE
jgi:hypothetical protein